MLNAQKLFRRSSRNKAQQADLRASVYASRQAFLQQGQVDWHLSGTQEKISAINELIGMATDGDGDDSHDQSHDHSQDHSQDHLDVATAPPQVKKPPFYAVVLFNDDYTPMEFVIEILQLYFALDLDRATEVMLTVHYRGKGVAGIYPRDIAETKAQQVNNYARSQGHPLLCQIEPQPE